MLNILQARLQLSMNPELPDVQAGFRKGRGIKAGSPALQADALPSEPLYINPCTKIS